MDQIQVNVGKPQFFKGNLKGFLRIFVSCILNPEFCGNEKFLAWNTAFFDRGSYSLLRERLSSVFVNFFIILSDYIHNEYIGVTFLPTDITTKSYVL